jgi:hypothetical protein
MSLLSQQPLTSERDGEIWYKTRLNTDAVYYEIWKKSLAIAEITGFYTYKAVVLALQNPLKRWRDLDLEPFIHHAKIISNQELYHSKLVAKTFAIPFAELAPVDHEKTLTELDLNEHRSLMRFSTILIHSSCLEERALANALLVDEAYHCWYTKLLLSTLGCFELPRLG